MELERPHPRTRLSVSLYALAATPVPAALSVLLLRLPFVPYPVGLLFTGLWIAALVWFLALYLPLRLRRARFCLGTVHVTSVSGVYFRTTRQMALDSVRYVTVIRGPLERRWGYAFVVIAGAGGHLLLEGVDAHKASALAHGLTRREQA